MSALFDALKRGLDFTRSPGTFSMHPHPPMVGYLSTYAPLTNGVLHSTVPAPAPAVLIGSGQFGVLPKNS